MFYTHTYYIRTPYICPTKTSSKTSQVQDILSAYKSLQVAGAKTGAAEHTEHPYGALELRTVLALQPYGKWTSLRFAKALARAPQIVSKKHNLEDTCQH